MKALKQSDRCISLGESIRQQSLSAQRVKRVHKREGNIHGKVMKMARITYIENEIAVAIHSIKNRWNMNDEQTIYDSRSAIITCSHLFI